MKEEFNLLKKMLVEEIDVSTASAKIHSLVSRADDLSLILPVMRAIDSFKDRKIKDFCGHLRQCLVYQEGEMEISERILRTLEPFRDSFNFSFHNYGYRTVINTEPLMMKGNKKLLSTFRMKKSRKVSLTAGDGELFRNYGYHHYLSLTQKLLMYLIRNQNKNETILATLPTGGGKSLAWELPALSGRRDGLTIVVVPTVALAKDQEQRSLESFSSSPFREERPVAYYGSLSEIEKSDILSDLSSGRLSILYISPEALMQKKFKSTVIEAAEHGLISMLVVDEAHLVIQWGRHFRPEFQLLSTLRNQIQEASPKGLQTLLLSATLTQEDTAVLKQVFSSDVFTEFRGDELRTEPVFYTCECRSVEERHAMIERLLNVVPRPIILYVATPAQAKEHFEYLWASGYRRIARFTGETEDEEKINLIERWRNNEIDIMIATSAFGMGVDKADIRTIITAYIPESISRFYQEVGRAGRDGYASLNYWLPFPEEDLSIVHNLTSSAVLTEELIARRWISLLNSGEHKESDKVWLDMYHAPEHLMFSITGERNKTWNIDTVLFLYRCGLIEILDSDSTSKKDYKILVKLLNIPVLESIDLLVSEITEYRDNERKSIDESISLVLEMLKEDNPYCYADYFVQDFPYAAAQCSGCPACRAMLAEPYYSKPKPEITTSKVFSHHKKVQRTDDLLTSYLAFRQQIQIVSEHNINDTDLINGIAKMINSGVNIVIYPPDLSIKALVERLVSVNSFNYLLLTLEEAESLSLQWLEGACALFYTKDPLYNKRLYSISESFLRTNKDGQVVHVAERDLFIPSRQKALKEIVDCSVNLSSIV